MAMWGWELIQEEEEQTAVSKDLHLSFTLD